ncbi:hypothetical protein PUN28_001944 [Cardiocondyla obscurior]|uniref:Uncharacterized protein n=1 Tax=Cardiocondyla obscurior TaxID=286306 RepID=A0AAW2GS00_9HYME
MIVTIRNFHCSILRLVYYFTREITISRLFMAHRLLHTINTIIKYCNGLDSPDCSTTVIVSYCRRVIECPRMYRRRTLK